MKHHLSYKSHKQMSEAFITAAFLSVSGGLQDAYTYICRGKVFANAQTGNIVLLSQNICDRNFGTVVHYLVPLLFFAFGVAAAELIRQKYQKTRRIHWRQLVLIIEILLLFLVGFLPDQSLKGIKKLNKENPEEARKRADEIIKNTYRTLLTRGMKGCYVYCVDDKMREYLKERLGR